MGDAKKKAALKDSDLSQIRKEDLNPKADEKNFVTFKGTSKIPYLACGAFTHGRKSLCRLPAGSSTDHLGYGRCKYHGGLSTGPKSPEGKAAIGLATKHGFYSNALGPKEKAAYEDMVTKSVVGLDHEIYMLKAKILVYLEKWREKWDAVNEKEGEAQADRATKVLYKESEGNSTSTAYYHAGTIEDKPLIRALETLGRLVDKHAKLNPGSDGDTLVNQVNAELRAASYGQVSVTWGNTKPQTRSEEGGANERG